MRNEERNPSDAIPVPGSDCEETYNTTQVNAKTAHRLEKLSRFRIDPALIKFADGARPIEGGYAIVLRALLSSPLDDTEDQEAESVNAQPNDRIASVDAETGRREVEESNKEKDHVDQKGGGAQDLESGGETSGRTKSVAVKKMKIKKPDDASRVLGVSPVASELRGGSGLRVSQLTLREAEVLEGLSHENIIMLEGFVEDVSKEMIWLIFPWEDNGTLKDFIASADWEIPERISLIHGVARGVEYLHSRTPPICHADLKSINILVNGKCSAVITDFGSAHHPVANSPNEKSERAIKELQPAPPVEAVFSTSTNTITLTGIQCTIRWAAPEVLENEEFSLASDIWALGWVAYEVMTNSIPFHDVKEPMVINRVVRGDVPSISNDVRMLLIQELCSVMGGCWKIDPSRRPTAKDCRGSISWMPMITPSLQRRQDVAGSLDHSAELLMKLAELHLRQSDNPNASKYYTKALNIYAAKDDGDGKATALTELASVHRSQREYSQATELYSQALKAHTDLGNKSGRANALYGLGDTYRLQKELSQAITFYSESLQVYTELGSRHGRAHALWGLAEIHRVQKEYSQAVTFYSESLQIHTDIGNKEGRAYALWGLAEVHRLQGVYSQAVTFHSECLQIRTSIGDRRGRASALWGLAESHRLQREYNQAMTLFSEALTAFTDLGSEYWCAFTQRSMAYTQHDQGHYSSAIDHYEQAAELFKNIEDSYEESSAQKKAADLRRSVEQRGAT